jgi:hypothetical protein
MVPSPKDKTSPAQEPSAGVDTPHAGSGGRLQSSTTVERGLAIRACGTGAGTGAGIGWRRG